MLTAVLLVKSTRGGLTSLGPKLADVPGISEVYTVTGEWDFVAIVRVREHEQLADVVTQRLQQAVHALGGASMVSAPVDVCTSDSCSGPEAGRNMVR